MVGMDAVPLFPSMTSKRTAKIVRKRVSESRMKMPGFNWKRGMIYIMANRHLLSNISNKVKKYLPVRKSDKGVRPGMNSKVLKNKEGNEDLQWLFTGRTPQRRSSGR